MASRLTPQDLEYWYTIFRRFLLRNLGDIIADEKISGVEESQWEKSHDWLIESNSKLGWKSALVELLAGKVPLPFDLRSAIETFQSGGASNPDSLRARVSYDDVTGLLRNHIEKKSSTMPEQFNERSQESRDELGLGPKPTRENRPKAPGIPKEDIAEASKADLGDTILDLYQKYKDTGDESFLNEAKSLSKKLGQRFSIQSLEIKLRRAALIAKASGICLSHGLVQPRTKVASKELGRRLAQIREKSGNEILSINPAKSPSFGGKQFIGMVDPNLNPDHPEETKVLARKRRADAQHPAAQYQYGSNAPSDTTKAPGSSTPPDLDNSAPSTPPPTGKKYVYDPTTKQFVLADDQKAPII